MHETRSFGKVLSRALVKRALHLEQNKLRLPRGNVTVITKVFRARRSKFAGVETRQRIDRPRATLLDGTTSPLIKNVTLPTSSEQEVLRTYDFPDKSTVGPRT